jgi:hypothetical protein
VGIARLVERWRRAEAGWMEDAPVAGALAAASVENTRAFGAGRGQPVARLGEPGDVEDPSDGVLGARSAWRPLIVPVAATESGASRVATPDLPPGRRRLHGVASGRT